MNFAEALEQALNNISITENGAIGYKTSGNALVDLNFAVSSLRSKSDKEIADKYTKALEENKNDAILWLFFARDVRGGLGERRLFKVCLPIVVEHVKDVRKMIRLIPEFGRFDDLYALFGTKYEENVLEFIRDQLNEDSMNYLNHKTVSLLAKWLKSENTSSKQSRELATKIRQFLRLSSRDYRKVLSTLRSYIDVTEVKMSANKFGEIDYSKVPSKASLNYKEAFKRHDGERYQQFIESVNRGEEKINSSVLFPYEIVHKYWGNYGCFHKTQVDQTIEALWKNLQDTVGGNGDTLVVADGSGSMCCAIGKGNTTAWEVATSLAIYFAERASGAFKNTYITFSSRPQLVSLSGSTLLDNLRIAYEHDECSNTNIKATFDLILRTAVSNHMPQDDMPKNILIISDMEFDYGSSNIPLFKEIELEYKSYGYELPRLIFWNVNSRTGTIPLKENDRGVVLLSGFSTNVVKMAMSGELDPYACLIKTLYSDRYKPIIESLL